MVAPVTQGKNVSDIVKQELAFSFNRAKCTVLAGQALDIGDVCETNADSKKIKVSAAVNEVQTITVGGTCTAGTLQLGVHLASGETVWTVACAWHATETTMTATIQAALDALLGANAIVISTIANTAALVMVFTFSGTGFVGLPQVLMDVDTAALTGATTVDNVRTTAGHASGGLADSIALEKVTATNEVQTVSFTGEADSGSFTLTFRDYLNAEQTTAAIAYTAAAATVETAINLVLGTDAVTVAGDTISGLNPVITITFDGPNYAGRHQDLVIPDTTLLLDGTEIVTAVAVLTTLGKDGEAMFLVRGPAIVDAGQLDYNSTTAANVVAALAALDILARTGPTYSEGLPTT